LSPEDGCVPASVQTAYGLAGLFWLSWLLAAAWTRRTASRPQFGTQTLYTVIFLIGFGMLMASTNPGMAALKLDPISFLGAALWTLSYLIKTRLEERFLRAELARQTTTPTPPANRY